MSNSNDMGMSPESYEQFMQQVVAEAKRRKQAQEQRKYQTPDGIVDFVRNVLHATPTAYQERILRAVVTHKRVAVRGPHGLGKTTLAAYLTLWGMLAFDDDVKVVTTASAWRQLEHYLWPEIKKQARPIRQQFTDLRVLNLGLKMTGKEAFAVASDDPALIEGAHAKTLIYVFDEAKSIATEVWDAAEGAFSGAGEDTAAEAYALAISTPGDTSGRFYEIHHKRPGLQDWHTEHVTIEEAIAAGRISKEWVDQRREQWGEESSVFQHRCLGNFDKSGEDNVIPLIWVELANERWYACNGSGDSDSLSYGVDPARYGRDSTTIVRMAGKVCEQIDYYKQEDTMQTTGRVTSRVDKHVPVAVDVIGIGSGIVDRLKELEYKVTGVNVAEAAQDSNGQPLKDVTDTFTFVNLRSYLWWMLKDALNPDNPDAIALPPDDRLIGDLTAPRYTYTSKGQIKVESKDEIRKRISRSTDAADGLALAYYTNPKRPGAASENRYQYRIAKYRHTHTNQYGDRVLDDDHGFLMRKYGPRS